MRVENNPQSSYAFKGLDIEPDAAMHIVKKVTKVEDWESISDAIPLMRYCDFRDFKFELKQDEFGQRFLKGTITEPMVDSYGKLSENVVLVECESDKQPITAIFKMFGHTAKKINGAKHSVQEHAAKFLKQFSKVDN